MEGIPFMTLEEQKEAVTLANLPPDGFLLKASRRKILGADNSLAGLAAILGEDPEFAQAIEFYEGVGTYLASLESNPQVKEYCRNFYQLQVLVDANLARQMSITSAARLAVVLKDLSSF